MATTDSTPEISPSSPSPARSPSASRSLVIREMSRPEVYFSWNARLSDWAWVKTRPRSSSSTACETLADSRTKHRLARGVGDAGAPGRPGWPAPAVRRRRRQRGHRRVDAVGHRQRADQVGQLADHDDDPGQQGPPPVRPDQRAEQPSGPGLQPQADAGRDVVGVLGGDPAPGVVGVRVQIRQRGGCVMFVTCSSTARPGWPAGRGSRDRRPSVRHGCRARRSGRRPAAPPGRPAWTVDARCATTSAVVAGQHRPQRLLDPGLGVDVQRGQRVVQHQHLRVADHRPGQRQPLPLAAGQRQALLADPGVQAPRQAGDEVGLRELQGGPARPRRSRPAGPAARSPGPTPRTASAPRTPPRSGGAGRPAPVAGCRCRPG